MTVLSPIGSTRESFIFQLLFVFCCVLKFKYSVRSNSIILQYRYVQYYCVISSNFTLQKIRLKYAVETSVL